MRIQSTNNYYLQSKNNTKPNFGKLIITEDGQDYLQRHHGKNIDFIKKLEHTGKKMKNYKFWDFVIDKNGSKIVSKTDKDCEIRHIGNIGWRYLQNSLIIKDNKGKEIIIYFKEQNKSQRILDEFKTNNKSSDERKILLTHCLEESEQLLENNEVPKQNKTNLKNLHLCQEKLKNLFEKYGE